VFAGVARVAGTPAAGWTIFTLTVPSARTAIFDALEIAMVLVSGLQCFSDLSRDADRLFYRNRPRAMSSASVAPSTNSSTTA
jgi:hypothetical protein